MNIRFYNTKMLLPGQGHGFEIKEGELWVKGNQICYIGDGKDLSHVFSVDEIVIWDREIDAKGNLLMPGFKDAHTHTAMTFLRSYADDLPLQRWLNEAVFPREGQLTADDIYWLDIQNPEDLPDAFDLVFQDATLASKRKWIIDNYDPYLDGKVCHRMLDAARDYISRHGVPKKRKLNLWRKYTSIKKFGKVKRR